MAPKISLSNLMWLVWLGVALAFLALNLYIFAFMFIHGTGPSGSKNDEWINKVCAPNGLFETVLTWGYYKASFRRFYNHYRLQLFPVPTAAEGKKAIPAKLIGLDGKELSLIEDYVQTTPPGVPLILNMGSFT